VGFQNEEEKRSQRKGDARQRMFRNDRTTIRTTMNKKI